MRGMTMSTNPSVFNDGTIRPRDEDIEKAKVESRRLRLKPFSHPYFPKLPDFRLLDYYIEAENSFINGCYRSCIICSEIAVELALKHTLIFRTPDWEETYWEIEVKKLRFSEVIKRLRENKKQRESLKNADWLRKVRNDIAAHPLYIGSQLTFKESGMLQPKGLEEQIWARNTMVRDLKKLLEFLDPEKRKEMEDKKITCKDDQGRTTEEYSVADFIAKRKDCEITDLFLWKAIQNELIEEVAFVAFGKMVETLNVFRPELASGESQ
jgi:hypothetical protein